MPLLFVGLPVVVSTVIGACGKTEETDTTGSGETAMIIRKPMPTPPAPLISKKAEAKKEGKQKPPRSQNGKPGKEKGLTQRISTPTDAPGQQTPDMQSGSFAGQGLYRVRKGDSLASIAERADVYNNPLKWTSLFRLNLDQFEGMKITPDFENRELPEGLELKFVTASEAQKNRETFGKRVYVVNVLSEDNTKKITPHAITLIRNGYKAYICTATVHNKEWIRLRAGFFRNRKEATEVGNRIASLLDDISVWVTKISQTEINNYCGDG